MIEKTKPEEKFFENDTNPADAPAETPDKGNSACSEDGQKKSYYYDDAYGYEVYDPEKEDDEEE